MRSYENVQPSFSLAPMQFSIPFILASQSPRRRHLLTLIGADFEVEVSHVDEEAVSADSPTALARHLALAKAGVVASRRPEALVLGADTIVVLDGDLLGKPADDDEARRTLRALSGQTHTVITGIALVARDLAREVVATEATQVTFAELSDREIDEYVATGSPRDKAGAYGIQDDRGALYVSRIDGDYYNVVGLPLHLLYRTLSEHFADVTRGAVSERAVFERAVSDRLRSNLASAGNPT